MRFAAKCERCNWVFQESDSTFISGMPPTCKECGADMHVVPIQEVKNRGLTYEVIIQCKETGVQEIEGFICKESDLFIQDKNSEELIATKFQMRLFEAISRIITKKPRMNKLLDKI